MTRVFIQKKNTTKWKDIDGTEQTCDSSERCGKGGNSKVK